MPWLYLGLAAQFSEGLQRQPHIVLAGSPERFVVEVAAAGGFEAVRVGLAIDSVFVLAFLAVTATIVSLASGRWWLPVIPASLDLIENGLIAFLLGNDVTEHMAVLLYLVALSKFVAYPIVACVVLVSVFGRHSRV
ncbi:hypothetical protein [Nocardioides sp. GCM10030258]|uniref:hypothetical protein n=1 Tax=unclassified Nocardioides TaxID=2615069 RepID=UPI003615E604